MTAAIPSRRKRQLIATIIADPYRKLAAITLAAGLWYFLNEQITRSIVLDMALTHDTQAGTGPNRNQVRVELGDGNVVGRGFSPRERVQITLTGQNVDIDRVEGTTLTLTVDFKRITDWSSTDYIEFEASDLEGAPNLDIEMNPPVVRLDVEEVADHQFPIQFGRIELTVDDQGLAKRLRGETAKFTPPTARVIGPARGIEALKRAIQNGNAPLRATIAASAGETDLSALLELNVPADSGLRLEKDPVMTIRADPRTERFELEIPIEIDDLALPDNLRNQYKLAEPPMLRRVAINAGGALLSHLTTRREQGEEALDQWAKQHLRLNIFVPPIDVTRTPRNELSLEARLRLQGPLQARVNRADYSLAEPLPFTLKRQ